MRWLAVFAVLSCLAAAGCAVNNDRSDEHRYGGFYGGFNGGLVR